MKHSRQPRSHGVQPNHRHLTIDFAAVAREAIPALPTELARVLPAAAWWEANMSLSIRGAPIATVEQALAQRAGGLSCR
jgi:hypothetical protein